MPSERTIVYVTEYYPPFGAGGAERTAALHAQILVRSGQPVTVITPNYGAASREVLSGIEVIRFPFHRLGVKGQQVHPLRFLLPAYHQELARHILQAVGGRLVRCLHAQNTHSLIGADVAARRLRVPLVAHIRDTAGICGLGAICLMESGIERPPLRCGVQQHMVCHVSRYIPRYQHGASLRRTLAGFGYTAAAYADVERRHRIYRRASRIAFASEGLRQVYRSVQDFQDETKHRVVHAPVLEGNSLAAGVLPDAVLQAQQAHAPILLYVGKVSKGKGADVLFAAHRMLLRDLPTATLVIAGHMTPEAWDYDRSRTIPLGFMDQQTLHALYRACDVVVLPSSWPEPLGWATLEAGRYGKPIVATRVGGIPEGVLDGVTGILVDRLDPNGLATALAHLIANPDTAREMGRQAQAFIMEQFGEHAVRRELEQLYEEL